MGNDARRNLDSLACIALACAALAMTVLIGEPPRLLTLLIGAPLALFAPGYALVLALFPRHAESRMRRSTRLMFSLGMSVVCNILLTLLLNFTVYGIHRITLTSGLAALTLALALIAIQRNNALPRTVGRAEEQPIRWPTFAQSSVAALSIAISLGAFTLATREALRIQTLDVIQLWLLPVADQPAGSITIGMRNVNSTISDFRITLDRDGYIFQEFGGLDVPAGTTWAITTTLRTTEIGTGPVVARLYASSNPSTALRRVQYALSNDNRPDDGLQNKDSTP
jgi:hypothetical protein